jgi:hypothetical protein
MGRWRRGCLIDRAKPKRSKLKAENLIAWKLLEAYAFNDVPFDMGGVGGDGPPVVLIQPLENIRPFALSSTGKVIK